MRRTFFAGCTATLFLVMLVQGGFAASGLINYQGRLTDKKGRPVTATVSVTFTFHDAEAGGNLLGGFSDTDQVTPDGNGLYATLIGDDPDNLVPDSIFKSERVWLNVNINGENLLPRKRLTSSGLAMTASSVMGGEVGRARFTAGTRVQAGDVVLLQEDGTIWPARYPGWNTVVRSFPEMDMFYQNFPASACRIGPNKVLIAVPCMARLAMVDGDKINLGNVVPVSGFDSFYLDGPRRMYAIAALGENRALIASPEYRVGPMPPGNTWNVLTAAVATADGTSLTLSTRSAKEDYVVPRGISSCVSLGANQVLIDGCIVATITGEGASASVVFGKKSLDFAVHDCCPLSSSPGKALIVFNDYGNANIGTAVVATVSGTGADATVSLGPKNVLGVGGGLLELQDGRVLLCTGISHTEMKACILTVTGNSVSSSTPVVYGHPGGVQALMSSGKVCFVNSGTAEADMATIEGTTLVFGERIRFSNLGDAYGPAGLENDRVLIVSTRLARIISAADQGNCPPGLNACIGVAESDALAGQSCLVTIPGGITEQFSGLTPGARYYATETGLLKDPYGSTGSAFLGVALTPNKLQVWR